MNSDESAKDLYWSFYLELYYQVRYYEHYKIRSQRLNTAISIFLLASSLAGISGLWLWGKFPNAWATVAAIVQVISASTFWMPFSEQIWAIDRLLPELDLLLNRVEHDWGSIGTKDYAEVSDLIFSYKNEQLNIEHRCIGSTYFPPNASCKKKAIKDRKDFYTSTYESADDQ